MIRTIIFDVGNVLIDFDWDTFIADLFPGQDELIDQLNNDVWGGGRWDRLDWGDDPEDVLALMTAHDPEHENELRYIFASVGKTLRKRPAAISWLKELKSRGYRLLYLSNYSHLCMEANPEVLDFLPLMDGGVFSCDVHTIKPNREIYQCITDKYNLVPSECVFIDDLEKNIRGARDFGFQGIQFLYMEQAQRDLNKLLSEG